MRRGGVTNGCAVRETVGLKPLPLGSGERESALRTTRRNASRSCSMRPNPLHGVGARFSQVGLAGIGASRCSGAGSCRLAIGPEEGGACENDKGRERSDSTERGSSSRTHEGRCEGSAPEPKAPPAENVLATRSTARCLGSEFGRSGCALSRITCSESWSANSRDSVCSHPSDNGIASSRHRVNHGTDVA